MNSFVTNEAQYFANLDLVFNAARENNVRLVPSLIWQPLAFCDAVGATNSSDLYVAGSACNRFATQFITKVVTRYASDDTILFWELGNELSLSSDLNNGKDAFCSHQLASFVEQIAIIVKGIDATKMFCTGHAEPRPSA